MAGWFYNEFSGVLNRVPTLLEAPYLIPGTGWRELKIPYKSTRAQAVADAGKEYPASATPGGSLAGNAGKDATKAGSAVGSGITAIFTQRSLWVRIVKVAIGAAMIIVGLSKLSGVSVPKVVPV
jgi:hypothetical protein